MENCIFCKIIAGEIPNHTVYEDEHSLAFLDINPHAKGHTVVIPKAHREHLEQMSDDELSQVMVAVKKAASKLQAKLNPDGMNIGWNDKPAGGQVVPHLHVHIMPRWEEDNGGSMHSIVNHPTDMAVADVAALLA